jgi:hypothetical protein
MARKATERQRDDSRPGRTGCVPHSRQRRQQLVGARLIGSVLGARLLELAQAQWVGRETCSILVTWLSAVER